MAHGYPIGESPHTPRKQQKLADIMRMWLSIAPRIRGAGLPRVVDCTAGSGDGSPTVIMEAAAAVKIRDFQLVCIERDRKKASDLDQSIFGQHQHLPVLWPAHSPEVHWGDCVDVLPTLASGFDPELFYYDPYGADFRPIDALRRVCHSRSDVLLHVSATTAKRNGTERLDSALRRLGKRHGAIWVDRIPDHQTGWHWSFIIATNWKPLLSKFKEPRDFYDLDSPEGRQWLEIVSTTVAEREGNGTEPTYRTYAEYLRHPKFRAIRAEAMERTNWRCVRCGARATEVHHLRYPPWGTFDVPENLEPICHRCHCEEHGKDD